MLIKRKLKEIPVAQAIFQNDKKHMTNYIEYINAYTAMVGMESILVVDFYNDQKELVRRFFCDGKNGITEEGSTWNTKNINYNRYVSYKENEQSLKTAIAYLEAGKFYPTSASAINAFLGNMRSEKYQTAEKRKYDRMKEHMDLFTDMPKDFEKYCDENVFENRYIVFENHKKTASCQCLRCKKEFTVNEKIKHKKERICPRCKAKNLTIAKRYQHTIKDEARVCIINKVGNHLVTVWLVVKRTYPKEDVKPSVKNEAYFYDVLIDNEKSYYYKFNKHFYGWGNAWNKTKYRNTCDKAHVYASNLESIYTNGITQYGLDLKKLKNAGAIDFLSLMDSSKLNPIVTKKLYNLGLYNLATLAQLLPAGEKFHEVLEINKAYLPLIKRYDISLNELMCLQLDKTILKEELFETFIKIARNPKGSMQAEKLKKVLAYMGFEKVMGYFEKQMVNTQMGTSTLMDLYCDYRSMSEELNKTLSKKRQIDMTTTIMFRYPRNIKVAHDGVSAKMKVVKNISYNKATKKLKKQYEALYKYAKDGYTVVYPATSEDFVNEGAALSHCVGNNSHYIKAHSEKTEITVFIRKNSELDKPYYTATFYTEDFRLKECYGKSHNTAPKSVQKFLAGYAKFMKKTYLQNKTAHKAA